MNSLPSRGWIGASLLISGCGALTLELGWIRAAADAYGGTVWALATVSALFLGGAALGAWLSGRLLKRFHPMRVYALAEIAIGGLSLLLPLALPGWSTFAPALIMPFWEMAPLLVAVQTLLLAPLILLPCVAMGVTIPAAVRAWGPGASRVSVPYGLNTLGATAGVMLGGWFLPGVLGLRAITLVAGLMLTLLGLAWLTATRGQRPVSRTAAAPAAPAGRAPAAWVLAAAGALALAIEILWARLGGLVFGSTVAAGTFVLAATIFWLAVGSLLAPMFRRVVGGWVSPPAAALCLASAGLLVGLWLLPYAPLAYLALVSPAAIDTQVPIADADAAIAWHDALTNSGRLVGSQIAAAFLFVAPGMLAVGLATPLLLDRVAAAGAPVGRAYAANAIGSLAGALVPLVAVPWIGIRLCFMAAVAGGLVLACGAARRRGTAVAAAVGAAALVISELTVPLPVPALEPGFLTSGPYTPQTLHPAIGFTSRADGDLRSPAQMLWDTTAKRTGVKWIREGPFATASIEEWTARDASGRDVGIDRVLRIDGKADASTSTDMPTQKLLGHIPCLLVEDPREVYVIGLATGVTANAAAMHGGRVTVAELCPSVVEASDAFRGWHGGATAEPNVEVVVADGRAWLAGTSRRFDVIVSEPPNPWVGPVARLFTREAFETIRSRLAPGGVAAQWMHLYSIHPDDAALIMRTFATVFPDAVVWEMSDRLDLLLTSRGGGPLARLAAEPLRTGPPGLRGLPPRVALCLAAIQQPIRIESASQIAALYRGRVRSAIRMAGELHTDDFPVLTYRAFRGMYAVTTAPGRAPLAAWLARSPQGDWLADTGLDSARMYSSMEVSAAIQELAAGNGQGFEVGIRSAGATWPLEPHAVAQRASSPRWAAEARDRRTSRIRLIDMLSSDPWNPDIRDAVAARYEADGDGATALSIRALTALATPWIDLPRRMPPPYRVPRDAEVEPRAAPALAEVRRLWAEARWIESAYPELWRAWRAALGD